VTARRCLVIVNPMAGGGRAGRLWPRIERRLSTALDSFTHVMTNGPCHATALTRTALLNGCERVVAVGGDGTFGDVATGFFDRGQPLAPAAEFALLPVGTGCDLPRSIGLLPGIDHACAQLAGEAVRSIDVGHVSFADHQGRPAERIFLNVASFGCGGEVSAAVAPARKRLGAKMTFVLASARVLTRYRDLPVQVAVDDCAAEPLRVTNYAVCNARFFGGGMLVAPDAELDDGLFDVTVWCGYRLMDFLLRQRQLYDGSHVEDARTRRLRVRRVRASSDTRVLLDVDGENPGTLPAEMKLLPAALRLKVGRS
jgi:diacylglycerol kinase (ATP)